MYFIRHLPSGTLYGTVVKDRMSVAAFKYRDDAKYVADCIATYKKYNQCFPFPQDSIYILDKKSHKESFYDHMLWIDDIPATRTFMENLGMRNLSSVHIVDNIEWENDEKYIISGRNIDILCPNILFTEILTKDLDIDFF